MRNPLVVTHEFLNLIRQLEEVLRLRRKRGTTVVPRILGNGRDGEEPQAATLSLTRVTRLQYRVRHESLRRSRLHQQIRSGSADAAVLLATLPESDEGSAFPRTSPSARSFSRSDAAAHSWSAHHGVRRWLRESDNR